MTFKAASRNNYSNTEEKGNVSTNLSSQEQEGNLLAEVLHSGVQSIDMKGYALTSIA